ncbi:MAG: 30S ribosomal protein S15 [Rickettsiales bacterium]|jgi:small subunit ribosomal protein S15|nr:30S ribosomal protein S15 [Rickettsiales bacterium]
MSITKIKKEQTISQFAASPGDTGSVGVQCAILTERIKNLTEHLKDHRKDFSSRNGLMVLVARRKRLLKYLERTSRERYRKLIEILGLKVVNNN